MYTAPSAFEIQPRTDDGPAPLSFGQELLWLLDRATPGATAWNVPRAFRVRGPLDVAALQRALDTLSARHEALRTVFAATADGTRQVILPPTGVPIRHVDLRDSPSGSRLAQAERIAGEEERTPFDLTCDTPLRVVLIELDNDDRLLCITSHHIVSDGWSKSLMFRELSALYDGFQRHAEVTLAPLPIQFADYAAWERGAVHQATLVDGLAYWREQLRDMPPSLELPTDRLRPATAGFDARRSVMILPRPLADAVARHARENDVTTYMMLLAAYAALLYRYSGSDDVVIGSPIAGRAQAETDGLIGYFANTLVLRTRFDDDPSFAKLLGRVRETCLDAYDHQDVPAEQLALELQKDRPLALAPLFNVVLTMEDVFDDDLRFGDATLHAIERESGPTKFDLTLLVGSHPDGLRLTLWYRTDLFVDATADRLLKHLSRLLEAAVDDPEQRVSALPMLTESEYRAASSGGMTAEAARDLRPLHVEILAVAQRLPQRVALVCDGDSMTYGELAMRAQALAADLRARGVGSGAVVGLALERSTSAVVGLLGILAAGAAYVPLDLDLPPARLATQIAEASVRVVVAQSGQHSPLPHAVELVFVDAPRAVTAGASSDSAVGLDDLAYVIFTSGSTGVPKGVAVTHRNVSAYVNAICARLEIEPDESLHFATVSSLAADLGNTAIFPALCTGGTLHLVPPDVATQPALFAEWSAAQPVEVLKITPSQLGALLDSAPGLQLPRRWLIMGGEACSWELVERVRSAAGCRLLNHYGPTETTIGACTLEIGAARDERTATVPIGLPLAGVRCYVRGARGELVPAGVPGELFIGGAGVARGYINRDELTAERFSPDPFHDGAGARVYRTGDRVRRLPTGALEFLGRLDGQVKIRGYRVELAEIEAALIEQPDVAHAAVVRRGEAGDEQLIAYAVLKSGVTAADGNTLRSALAARLPAYMVPGAIVLIDRMPLTANGKLDRGALPSPPAESDAVEAFVAPRTPTEATIATIFAGVLKSGPVSIGAHFTSLGFHSILAIRALGALAKTLGVRMPLRTFFDAPTIERLAVAVDAELDRNAQRDLEAALSLAEQLDDDEIAKLATADAASDRSP